MWRNFHKANSLEEKARIKERIDLATDEINTLYGQRNACKRIISTYDKICEDAQRKFEIEQKYRELNSDKKQYLRK